MGLIERLFGPGKTDPDIQELASQFLREGKVGCRIADVYPDTTRLRELIKMNPDKTYVERSKLAIKYKGEIVIIDEGFFISDGK